MTEFLEDENLKKIYEFISSNPGLSLNKIAESLNMKIINVANFLQYLEKKGIIYVKNESGSFGYYIGKSHMIHRRDKRTQKTRMEIYNILSTKPGLHLSKIAELLDMNISLAKYHLAYMQKNNLVSAVKDDKGYYKRFYIKDSGVGFKDKEILSLLRQRYVLKIVLVLLKNPNLTHKEIMEKLNISLKSKLSYHLAKLVDSGIVNVATRGKEKGYCLKDRNEIIRILDKHILDIELQISIEGLKDTWEDFKLPRLMKK